MRAPIAALAVAALLALGAAAAQEGAENRTPQGRPGAKARKAVAAVTAAQQSAGEPAAPAQPPQEGDSAQVLEEVRRQEDISSSAKGLSYDPAGRRDPFISPAEAMKLEEVGQCEGEGLECWLITELDVVGIIARRSGSVALVIGPEGYGATLRPGDKLYDGEVLSVDAATGTVVFRQKVSDPTRIKPYRDIEKKLNTSREGGL